jgi:nucleotide-binding universal stress UspA family protein
MPFYGYLSFLKVSEMHEKIMVATMGEYMDEIMKYTLDIIQERKTEVIGIYVVETSTPFLTPKKVKEMMATELRDQGEEILESMRQEFQSSKHYMIKFKKLLREGDPAEEIVKAAEEEGVDLIILGTGKDFIDKRLLGSVSEKVVHSAPCNIMLIKTI